MAQTKALIAEHQLLLTTLSTIPKPIDNPERHALNFFVKSTDSQLSPSLQGGDDGCAIGISAAIGN